MDNLCMDLGICRSPEDQDCLCHEPPLKVDAFVDAVFVAEGLDPSLNGHLVAIRLVTGSPAGCLTPWARTA
jgi:hypothetical protein